MKNYRCAYEDEVLNKVFSTKFAKSGSPAYPVLKRFHVVEPRPGDRGGVDRGDHMNPDAAGQKWVAQNKAKVLKWLGK